MTYLASSCAARANDQVTAWMFNLPRRVCLGDVSTTWEMSSGLAAVSAPEGQEKIPDSYF